MTTYSIGEVSTLTGLSQRALRHYEQLGLILPIRRSNAYREYDEVQLARLQHVVVLRELGLSLADISRSLASGGATVEALRAHTFELRRRRDRLDRQISALTRSVDALEKGQPLMTAQPFDGFEHEQYQDEVTEKWGAESYANGDAWWRSMSDAERSAWKGASDQLLADWRTAAEAGEAPDGTVGQALAARQAEWLRSIPATPSTPELMPMYLRGLGEMYVADERFAANYGGQVGATFVRDALAVFADRLSAGQ